MKKCYFIFLLFILVQELSAQSSKAFIRNQTGKPYVIYDYLSQDSLFSSKNENDSLVLDNENNFKTLLLFVNNKPGFNIIVLDKEEIHLNINSEEKLDFKTEGTNTDYQKFQQGLKHLKAENAKPKEIDDYIYHFYIQNGNLLTALEYAHASILYNIYNKDSCQALFDKLNPALNTYELWGKTEKLLLQEIKVLEINEHLPNFEVINTEKQKLNLDLQEKETVLIFWATWCTSCINEIALLQKNTAQIKEKSIVLINLNENIADWLKAIDKFGLYLYTNYHLENDFDNEMALSYQINALPHHSLIDANRKLIKTNFELFQNKEQSLNIYFENNESALNKKNQDALSVFLKNININNIQSLELEGFADKTGSQESNLELSAKRVKSVEQFLNFQVKETKKTPLGEINNENLEENRKVNIRIVEKILNIPKIDESDSCTFIFEYAKTIINPEGNNCLNQIIEKTKGKKDFIITINTFSCGHEGLYKVNKQISKLSYSEARAKTVKNFLVRNGIEASRIISQPKGIDQSLEKSDDEHYLKRRAEVILKF